MELLETCDLRRHVQRSHVSSQVHLVSICLEVAHYWAPIIVIAIVKEILCALIHPSDGLNSPCEEQIVVIVIKMYAYAYT